MAKSGHRNQSRLKGMSGSGLEAVLEAVHDRNITMGVAARQSSSTELVASLSAYDQRNRGREEGDSCRHRDQIVTKGRVCDWGSATLRT